MDDRGASSPPPDTLDWAEHARTSVPISDVPTTLQIPDGTRAGQPDAAELPGARQYDAESAPRLASTRPSSQGNLAYATREPVNGSA